MKKSPARQMDRKIIDRGYRYVIATSDRAGDVFDPSKDYNGNATVEYEPHDVYILATTYDPEFPLANKTKA